MKYAKKTGKKLNTLSLSRVTSCMALPKGHMLLNTFFLFQFICYPLVWMFHSRGKNNKINWFHERNLRIICSDKKSTFTELLEKDNSVSIYKQNLRFLAIEMFKLKRGLAPTLCKEWISHNRQNRYNWWNNVIFLPLVKSVYKDLESLSYFGSKIWEIYPAEIKETESLLEFKAKIKN